MKAELNMGYQGERTTKQAEHCGELFKFATNVGLVLSAIAGLWGVSCLVFGLKECGVVGLLKSLIIAVTGG